MEGGRVKRSLQLVPGRDFEIVPEPVWRALYHWYGANLSLPRPVSGHASAQHLTNVTSVARTAMAAFMSQRENFFCLFLNFLASRQCANIKEQMLKISNEIFI